MRPEPARLLESVAALFWLVSLPFVAFSPVEKGVGVVSGLGALLIGWMGVLAGAWGWFANPLMLLAAAVRERRWSVTLSVAALGVALTSLHHPQICGDDGCHPARLGIGAWLWITSSAVLLAGTVVRLRAPLSPHPPA